MIWIQSLTSITIISFISLVGALFLAFIKQPQKIIFILVALSVGALFGDVFIHILPEIVESSTNLTQSFLLVLVGIMIFFVLEKFLRWGHHHDLEECSGYHIKPVGKLNLLSDGIHNLIDGAIIAVGYLTNPAVGVATTIAVVLHEIPQEMGDFALLLHSGFSKKQAIFLNLLSALMAFFGAIVVLVLGGKSNFILDLALPLAAGSFIYIAGSDLVPELHKTTAFRQSFEQLLAIVFGVALMFLLLAFE